MTNIIPIRKSPDPVVIEDVEHRYNMSVFMRRMRRVRALAFDSAEKLGGRFVASCLRDLAVTVSDMGQDRKPSENLKATTDLSLRLNNVIAEAVWKHGADATAAELMSYVVKLNTEKR